jgi:hypothetical protein
MYQREKRRDFKNLNNMENTKQEMKRSIRRQQETNHLKNRLQYIWYCSKQLENNKKKFFSTFVGTYIYKNTATPCNCWMCQEGKYSRKVKHKKDFD